MILLTGASGFIGRHLLSKLIEIFGRENILVLSSKPTNSCRFLLHNNYNFDAEYVLKNGYENIKTIIHAGAFTPKNVDVANDIELSNSNILNTQKLLNLSLPLLENFIFLSTLDVYDNTEEISEETFEKPISLYGFSKLYCEKMIEFWGNKNKKIVQVLRIGHVYGAGEEAYDKIIPSTFKKILRNESVQIWGTGEELRSFINVNDVVGSIIKSLTLKESIGVVNVVSSQPISIIELVKKIINISKSDSKIEYIKPNTVGRSLIFNNAKLKKCLLFNETKIEVGLKDELDYMKSIFIK
jgi:nucleoside-diphosphate-sugar epimerase